VKDKPRTTTRKVVDLTKSAFTSFGVGVKRGNPRRCLRCGKQIKRGETWSANTSAEDPEGYGRYTVIQHSPHCPD